MLRLIVYQNESNFTSFSLNISISAGYHLLPRSTIGLNIPAGQMAAGRRGPVTFSEIRKWIQLLLGSSIHSSNFDSPFCVDVSISNTNILAR